MTDLLDSIEEPTDDDLRAILASTTGKRVRIANMLACNVNARRDGGSIEFGFKMPGSRKREVLSLGSFPRKITAAMMMAERDRLFEMVRQGEHPRGTTDDEPTSTAPTFREVLRRLIRYREADTWRAGSMQGVDWDRD